MATEDEIRLRLEPEYLVFFQNMGMTPQEAKEAFDGLFEKAKEQSGNSGTQDMDATRLCNLAQTDPGIRRQLDWKAAEGVREEDFDWWWNMPDLERQFLLAADDMNKIAHYTALRESGISKEDAALRLKSAVTYFFAFLPADVDPTDIHAGLPVELKARVIQFIEGQAVADPSGSLWSEKVAEAGSANALIRNEIRRGNL